MPSIFRFRRLCIGAAVAISTAFPAAAAEWSRSTWHGGDVTRSVSRDGNVYTGTTARSGANGGTYASSTTCVNGIVARCATSYAGVGANGRTFSGERRAAYGPFRAGSAGRFTGPNGNTVYGFRWFRR